MRDLLLILESYQTPLFHFTTMVSAIAIIETNSLQASAPQLGNSQDKAAVSFTRNHAPDRQLPYSTKQFCFILNSNMVQTKPVYGDRMTAGNHGDRESEQRSSSNVDQALNKCLGIAIARNSGMYDITTPEGLAELANEKPNMSKRWINAQAICEANGLPIIQIDAFKPGWFLKIRSQLR